MNNIIDYNILDKLHKPLHNDNDMNTCWFNSTLYLMSSHPYIFFQYLLLSKPANYGSNFNIDKQLYFDYILYNYKYVRTITNKSNKLYDKSFHVPYHAFLYKHNLVQRIPYGDTWDANDTFMYLLHVLTKGNSYGNNELSYLSYKVEFLSHANDIKKYLKRTETVNNIKTTYILFGFTRAKWCLPAVRNSKDYYAYINHSAHHWTTYIRFRLDLDDDNWYHFDALYGNSIHEKARYIKTKKIYECKTPGEQHQIICLYIDIKKFNNIFSNKRILKIYNNFVETMKPESSDKNFKDTKKEIESLELQLKQLLNTIHINPINLLTIKELEIKFDKYIITDEYYKEKDKRAYFNMLNSKLGLM